MEIVWILVRGPDPLVKPEKKKELASWEKRLLPDVGLWAYADLPICTSLDLRRIPRLAFHLVSWV